MGWYGKLRRARQESLAKSGTGAYGVRAMEGPLFMDAVITPHRSLTPRGAVMLIGAVTLFDAGMAAVFVAVGAAPIPIFFAIGLFAMVIALIASHRASQRRECIQVSAAEVRVVEQERGGEQLVWVSPTAFTRVSFSDGEDHDETALRLHLSDKAHPVAQALTRRERREFARALEAALQRARAGF
jgi:uncharacterized membrane protein